MIDRDGFAEMVGREQRLYHLIWNATPEKIASVREHGLEATKSIYHGHFESREGHVYLGRMSHIKKVFFRKPQEVDCALFSVDLGYLQPAKVNPDEDHFAFWSEHGRAVTQRFRLQPSPSEWVSEWAKYLGTTVPSLGEWAEAINLGADTKTTRYSIERGSLAYRGIVPPAALHLCKANFEMAA